MTRRKKELTYGTFITIVLVAAGFFIVVDAIRNFYNEHPAVFWLIFSLIIGAVVFGGVLYIKRKFFD